MSLKLYLLFAGTILLTASCSDNILDEQNNITTKSSITNVLNQDEAKVIGDNLARSFESGISRSSGLIYPDYYGGGYIDQENNFVILIKGDTLEHKNALIQRTKSNNFKLSTCDYSYNELKETIDDLNLLLTDESKVKVAESIKLYSFGILDNENRIFIGLGNCTSQNIEKFKGEFVNAPYLVFINVDQPHAQAADVKPGGVIHTNAVEGSIGYRARRNGQQGIVTSGHLASVGESLYLGYYQDYLGSVTVSYTDGAVDAAFCPVTNSIYYLSNITYNNYTLGGIGFPYVGLSVAKEGKSTGRTTGSITATNVSVYLWIDHQNRNEYLIGVVCCSYDSAKGDSGGIVYSTSGNNILGIHAGADSAGKYFVPAGSINSALGLTMY